VADTEVSGKVFRYLSAMHPSLSKAERKQYAAYDPDKWYPWTPEVSGEFTDLMRRSPRDSSFARGFAYVAQRAVPEGHYVPTRILVDNIATLPAAYRGPGGSGFSAERNGTGHAIVRYEGMPGFANVCIAIQGELTERLRASGAQNVLVKHGATCRLSGGDLCEFEVEWTGEEVPVGAEPVDVHALLGDQAVERDEPEEAKPAATTPPAAEPPQAQPQPQSGVSAPPAPAREAPPRPAPAAAAVRPEPASSRPSTASASLAELEAGDISSDDLFVQLRKRLAEADRQSSLFNEAQQEIDRLRVELGRVRADAEAEVAKARAEAKQARDAVAELKRKVRDVLGDA
jgi:hypothetical protein